MSEKFHAVAARRIFDGVALRKDSAVVIEGDTITAVLPRSELSSAIPCVDLAANAWLAPGFIDIQVNGGGDVLFNDEPVPDAIRSIAAAHRKFGTTSLLPTLISDSPEKMAAACDAVESLVGVDPGILGIHLEGPFLSPEKPGVHDPRALRQPSQEDLKLLTAPRRGAMLVTLAPERVPLEFIAALAAADVRVSLGHSMATYAQTKEAMAAGLTCFTHLFNAMRPLDSREPGPIAAALEVGASLVRHDRGWRARRPFHSSSCTARPRQADCGHRCHAAGRRHARILSASGRDHFGPRRPMREERWQIGRRLSHHGRRSA